jgi:hypothetical protein
VPSRNIDETVYEEAEQGCEEILFMGSGVELAGKATPGYVPAR